MLLLNGFVLCVVVDNNYVVVVGVLCVDFGVDGVVCVIGYLILQNCGYVVIVDGGWKFYLYSICCLLWIDWLGFVLWWFIGDLYELMLQLGLVWFVFGECIELLFVVEYWLLCYSDVILCLYVVVDGVLLVVLCYDDIDNELCYVELLLVDVQNNLIGNVLFVVVWFDFGCVLLSVKCELLLFGMFELCGVEFVLLDLLDVQVVVLCECVMIFGFDGVGVLVCGFVVLCWLLVDFVILGGYWFVIGLCGVLIEGYDCVGFYYGVQMFYLFVLVGGGLILVMFVEDVLCFMYCGMYVDFVCNFKQLVMLCCLIDQMSVYKFNCLYLYLFDDEGWCIEIFGLFELIEIGGCCCYDLSEMCCLLLQFGFGLDNCLGGGYLMCDDYVVFVCYVVVCIVQIIFEIDMFVYVWVVVVMMEVCYWWLYVVGCEQEVNVYWLFDLQDMMNLMMVQFYDWCSDLNLCVLGVFNFVLKVICEIVVMYVDVQVLLQIWYYGGDEVKNIFFGGGFQLLNGIDLNKGCIDLVVQDKLWVCLFVCMVLFQCGEIKLIDELLMCFVKQVSVVVNVNGIGMMVVWQDGIKYVNGLQDFSMCYVMVLLWDMIFWGVLDSVCDLSGKGYQIVFVLFDYLYFDFLYMFNLCECGYYWGLYVIDEYKVFLFVLENLLQNVEVMGDCDGNLFEVMGMGFVLCIEGMQGQVWGEVMCNDIFFEYMIYL